MIARAVYYSRINGNLGSSHLDIGYTIKVKNTGLRLCVRSLILVWVRPVWCEGP